MHTVPPEFEEVHATLRPRIQRYLSRLVGPDEAEDLTQETFARIDRALPHFRGDCRLSTWVYRIATNVAVDRMRAGAFTRRHTAPLEAAGADPAPGAAERLARDEMGECVRSFIDALPPADRVVVVLGELEGLRNREIARALGTTVGAVKIRLHRARARLRARLQEGCSLSRDERNELVCEPKPLRILS